MTILTQEKVDAIKLMPSREQVLSLLDLICEGKQTIEENRRTIIVNLSQPFEIIVFEIIEALQETAKEPFKDPDFEKFFDENGKEFIRVHYTRSNGEVVNFYIDKDRIVNKSIEKLV